MGVKVVIYDFDQTITQKHISKRINMNGKYKFNQKGQLKEYNKLNYSQLLYMFGGLERVKRLHEHFKYLMNNSIELIILSMGFKSVIQKAIVTMGLDKYFPNSMIFGKNEIIPFNLNKSAWIENFKQKRQLQFDDILFIDDEPKNIERSKLKCLTLKVDFGITSNHMRQIERSCIKKSKL